MSRKKERERVAPPTRELLLQINEQLPNQWKFDGGQIVDEHGNVLAAFELSGVPEGYDNPEEYEERAKRLFWAMGYGPDVMLYVLRLAAALYSGNDEQASVLLEKILEYTATAFCLDREQVDEAVKPAEVLLVERSLQAWTDAAASLN